MHRDAFLSERGVLTRKSVHAEIIEFAKSGCVTTLVTLFCFLRDCFRTRLVLQARILALRHQLLVLERAGRGHRSSRRWADRIL